MQFDYTVEKDYEQLDYLVEKLYEEDSMNLEYRLFREICYFQFYSAAEMMKTTNMPKIYILYLGVFKPRLGKLKWNVFRLHNKLKEKGVELADKLVYAKHLERQLKKLFNTQKHTKKWLNSKSRKRTY